MDGWSPTYSERGKTERGNRRGDMEVNEGRKADPEGPRSMLPKLMTLVTNTKRGVLLTNGVAFRWS